MPSISNFSDNSESLPPRAPNYDRWLPDNIAKDARRADIASARMVGKQEVIPFLPVCPLIGT